MTLTVVIPVREDKGVLGATLTGIPSDVPVIVVDDHNEIPVPQPRMPNVRVIRLEERGYFTGAVNAGIKACNTDVLILNQDVRLTGTSWLDMILEYRDLYAMIGERIQGKHPVFPTGYIHGTFMFLRRDLINTVGLLNAELYPLWGSTAEYQIRAARAGFSILPLQKIPGFKHLRDGKYGSSIKPFLQSMPQSERRRFLNTPVEISVIILSYNYGRFIRECLDSLMAQTFQSFEIILVDDQSTDRDSWPIARDSADPWKLINVYRPPRNLGTAGALNFGIRRSHGQYITFLSADDRRAPRGLQALWEALQDTERTIAFDDVELQHFDRENEVWRMGPWDVERIKNLNTVHAGIMYPKSAWVEVGGYPVVMARGREDWAFNLALLQAGYKAVHVHETNYWYRRHDANRTLRNTTPHHRAQFLDTLKRLYPRIYQEDGMACCGKGDPAREAAQAAQSAARRQKVQAVRVPSSVPDDEAMEMVQYVGRKTATPYPIQDTNTVYRFGLNKPLGWVFSRDVPQLLQIVEGGVNVFKRYSPPEVVQPDGETADETAPVEPPKVTHSKELPDISRLTVKQVKDMTFSPEELKQLFRDEKSGKARKGMLSALRQLHARKTGE